MGQIEGPELARIVFQFVMGAHLREPSIDQDRDGVGLADGVVAVSGKQNDLLARELGKQFEDLAFPNRVQTGTRLVEHE